MFTRHTLIAGLLAYCPTALAAYVLLDLKWYQAANAVLCIGFFASMMLAVWLESKLNPEEARRNGRGF